VTAGSVSANTEGIRVFFDLHAPDFVTIGLLVVLEGLLSADNALVMAIMVLGLPAEAHQKALRYGLIGGFAFRVLATLLAAYLISVAWIKLLGGLYLAYLTWSHFHGSGGDRHEPPKARPGFGLSAFWATVVRVELVNLAFSIDSILVAVAMSRKLAVVLAGGILGIIAMRLVVGQLLQLIRRYPALVDGAFVIIGWVALKLVAEYLHEIHVIPWEIPRSLSLGLIVVIFVASFLYARRHPPPPDSGTRPSNEVIT
jgi:YkoY family integral membrane protein